MKRSLLVVVLCSAVILAMVFPASGVAAEWTKVSTGSNDWAVAIDFEGARGWLLTGTGKVLKTIDGGDSWQQISSLPQNGAYDMDFVDAKNGWVAAFGTVFRTADGGQTWSDAAELPPNFYRATAVMFVSKKVGWAIADIDNSTGGVLKTTDGGVTWMMQFTQGGLGDVFFTDARHGCAVGDRGAVFTTDDGGLTWEPGATPGGASDNLSSVNFLNARVGWASGSRGGIGGIVLKTTDGGETWSYSLQGPARYSHYFEALFRNRDVGFAVGVALPDSSGGMGETGVDTIAKVFKTTDGGVTWTDISPASHDSLYCASIAMNRIFAAGDNADVWSMQVR